MKCKKNKQRKKVSTNDFPTYLLLFFRWCLSLQALIEMHFNRRLPTLRDMKRNDQKVVD